jgi:small subunit ribosomal protein S18
MDKRDFGGGGYGGGGSGGGGGYGGGGFGGGGREGRDNREGGKDGKDNREKDAFKSRGGFGRKKVCPFLLDKTLVLDYKNLKVVQRFISETGRIVPRHISGVSAKYQRKLTKHIKRARNLGLIAPAIDG